ncbi:MAG TPA: NUDIX domain-containing protein [Candidatus Saccharimonadales bacterium]
MKYDTATPFTAVYVIFRREGKIAFLLRENTDWMNGYYTVAAGKVEKNEPILQAAVREIKEEVGVTVKPENLKFLLVGDRHDEVDWIDFWFEATDWEGELHNAEPHVHKELVWFDPHNLPENIVPSVRFYLEQIDAGKQFAAYGWA